MGIRFTIVFSIWLGAAVSGAADVASRIVGYNVVDCPAGSDTIVSVPFHRPASFSGAVAGSLVVNGSEATITPKANPVFAAGEFTNEAHYLQFVGAGAKAGFVYSVETHSAGAVTIDMGGDDLSGVADGDRFEIIPHWTLETLFPKATQTAIHVSTGKLSTGRKSRVLFFDDTTGGIALAPDRVYFLTAEGWFQSDAGLPAADDVIIPPGKAFVIRHPATEAATRFIPHQMVVESSYATPLQVRGGGAQDNVVGLMRPVPVKLSDLDLTATFEESASNESGDRADELLVYDNLAAAVNKQPATTYFRVSGEWRKDDGSTYPPADMDEISPSTGLVIRKSASTADGTLHWINLPRYR
jgi:uncharacterized protein (TIGR02597 family)